MIRINQIKISPEISLNESALDDTLKKKIIKSLRLKNGQAFDYRIVKKSVDSRKKPEIFIVYSINVNINGISEKDETSLVKKVNDNNIMLTKVVKYQIPTCLRNPDRPRPVITGFGPAGMFCGLFLARAGLKPIILERGEAVEERLASVEGFWNGQMLKPESNAQFGEGGAGTFSDGKLNTQVKEVYGRITKVLETFVEFGADKSILYDAKPHIGSDKLIGIVRNIRNEIIQLGGEVRFNTKLTDIAIKDAKIESVSTINTLTGKTDNIYCDTLVLAIGHSARDTFETLSKKLTFEKKSFAVGLRIEHPQELINIHEFGDGKYKNYAPASYKLTHKAANGHGVYSFCMCPGGFVVNASSEPGHLAVNGMSYSKRDSSNANSALIVTVNEEDFKDNDVLAGVHFQRELEKKAYELCGGNIPVQRFEDFKENKATTAERLKNNSIQPMIKGSYAPANLREMLPSFISEALVEGVQSFDRQIKGFNNPDAVFSGIESRTSSPVRIVRDDELMAVGFSGIYPCGEGAGYAGGITSAAIDGLKVYEAICNNN